MTSLLIRNLDPEAKKRLRIQAAEHGRSMEEEARILILEGTRARTRQLPEKAESLGAAIRAIIEPLGGVHLDIPPRGPGRDPPTFD